jgi:rsbT co-antagonist protein RsbR
VTDLAELISKNETWIREEWLRTMSTLTQRSDLMASKEFHEQSAELLNAIVDGVRISGTGQISKNGWDRARDLLSDISASRARQGFSPSEVSTFCALAKEAAFCSHPEGP